MRSPNSRYIPAIDHLRALAALLVLEVHAASQFYNYLADGKIYEGHSFIIPSPNLLTAPFAEGQTGVTLFMVLSGFIYTYAADGKSIRYPRFLFNRMLRIYPLVLVIAVGGAFAQSSFTIGGLARIALFPFELSPFHPPLPHLHAGKWTAMFWTLSPEFQFYFVFPFLIAAMHRWGGAPIIALIAATVAARAALIGAGYDVYAVSYMTLYGRLDQLLVGMLVARYLLGRGGPDRNMKWLAIAGLIVVVIVLQVQNVLTRHDLEGREWRIYYPLIEAAAWGIFLVGYVCAMEGVDNLFSRALALIGTVSFSIYLLHYGAIYLLLDRGWLFRPTGDAITDTIVDVALFAAAIIAVSGVSYYVVERPFLKLRVRHFRDDTASPTRATSPQRFMADTR